MTRSLRCAVPAAVLLTGIACAPLMRPQSPNAAGVQFVSAAGGPRCKAPEGVLFDPERACAPQFHLDNAGGIAASYGRRLWGVTQTEGMNLRVGPELVGAWFPERRLTAPLTTAPAEVSEWVAAGLIRFDFYDEGSAGRKRDQVLNRLSLSFGAGLGYGRFREGDVLINGATNVDRTSDTVVGPAVNVGLGYWITRDWILRGDGYVLFSKPELSFPWNRYPTLVGIGVVKIF